MNKLTRKLLAGAAVASLAMGAAGIAAADNVVIDDGTEDLVAGKVDFGPVCAGSNNTSGTVEIHIKDTASQTQFPKDSTVTITSPSADAGLSGAVTAPGTIVLDDATWGDNVANKPPSTNFATATVNFQPTLSMVGPFAGTVDLVATQGTGPSAVTRPGDIDVIAVVEDCAAAWTATGFHAPVKVNGLDDVNAVKGGSTVPLKFNVFDENTVEVTDVSLIDAVFTVTKYTCDTTDDVDTISVNVTGSTVLRYADAAFIQNWTAPKVLGCYRVSLELANVADPLVAQFKITK